MFIDFDKVFDAVKQYISGIRGAIQSLYRDYLTKRVHQTVHGHISSSNTISLGIPQVSVLGPIPFLM